MLMDRFTLFLRTTALMMLMTAAMSTEAHVIEVNGIYYDCPGPSLLRVTTNDGQYNSYSGDVKIPGYVMHNEHVDRHVRLQGLHSANQRDDRRPRDCHRRASVSRLSTAATREHPRVCERHRALHLCRLCCPRQHRVAHCDDDHRRARL